jgi:hypothetical protein
MKFASDNAESASVKSYIPSEESATPFSVYGCTICTVGCLNFKIN